jgi:hypothetical protein
MIVREAPEKLPSAPTGNERRSGILVIGRARSRSIPALGWRRRIAR